MAEQHKSSSAADACAANPRAGRPPLGIGSRRQAVDPNHPALEPPRADLDYERPGTLDRSVFGIAAVVVLAFVAWGITSPATLKTASGVGLDWVVTNFGWLFALSATGMVAFMIWLALSKYGSIPLGRDGEEPEFSTVSWIAMMFSAGMGIGLMFYGAAEPLAHFVTPPPGTGEIGTARTAMATALFHWGLHPWAIYALVGVSIAYSVFRKGRPLTISAVFESLLGKRQAVGAAGKIVDVFAIFATLFGSATSLGLGALQIAEGVRILGWAGNVGNTFNVILITVLTICFILSAVSGISKGIQYLSNINMVLAVALALFVFVVGPTVFILNLVPTTLGSYLQDLMFMSARTGADGSGASTWLSGWTIFYWAWWISWTPFVGMFIARISRGRTIRQFVAGVLLLPGAVSLAWFAIFGGAAIDAQANGVDLAGAGSQEAKLFALLGTLPWPSVTAVIVMVLVAIFFVSGADASSVVMGTISENGTIQPRRWTVIFWGAATGVVAAVMLVVGGSDALSGVQSITIMAAFPFMLVMLAMAVSLAKELHSDPLIVRSRYARKAMESAILTGVSQHGDDFTLSVRKSPPGEGVGALVDEADRSGDLPALADESDGAESIG